MVDSARQKVREQQQREAAQRRKSRVLGVTAIVLVAVLGLVGVFWLVGQQKREQAEQHTAEGTALAQALTSIPASTFDAVGAQPAQGAFKADPQGRKAGDKGRVLYIGAEFCPYCAVERLALTSALSRFGTFEGLKDTLSSPNEGPVSNIPTVTYTGSTYRSDVLDFTAVETADRMQQPTGEKPSAEDEATFRRLQPEGGIPFVHYGAAWTGGATFNAAELFAGRQEGDLAAKLKDPKSAETKLVVGAANVITAQICKETAGKPANVCSSKGALAGARALR